MATKTTKGRFHKNSTAITVKILAQGSGTVLASYSTTTGSEGEFSIAVTEALSGWYDVRIYVGSVVKGLGTIYYPSDSAGTYFVNDPSVTAVTVLPGRDRAVAASLRGQIAVYLGELITISRRVEDANGNGVDLSGKTLQFVIQDARGTDIAVIGSGGSGSITISGTNNDTYSFTVPTAASAKVGNYEYSLNDVGSPKALLASGDWLVQRRAVKDP